MTDDKNKDAHSHASYTQRLDGEQKERTTGVRNSRGGFGFIKQGGTGHAALVFLVTYTMVMQLLYLPGVTSPVTFAFAATEEQDQQQNANEQLDQETSEIQGEDQQAQGSEEQPTLEGESLFETLEEETNVFLEPQTAKAGLGTANDADENTGVNVQESGDANGQVQEEGSQDPTLNEQHDQAYDDEREHDDRAKLPEGLVDASEVVAQPVQKPAEEEDRAEADNKELANHIDLRATVTGATQRTYQNSAGDPFEFEGDRPQDEGAYLVGKRDANVYIDVPAALRRLGNGRVAGTAAEDRLTVTVDVPYYYYEGSTQDARGEGAPKETYSSETWKTAWGGYTDSELRCALLTTRSPTAGHFTKSTETTSTSS